MNTDPVKVEVTSAQELGEAVRKYAGTEATVHFGSLEVTLHEVEMDDWTLRSREQFSADVDKLARVYAKLPKKFWPRTAK